jgi:hypothetical protein
MRLERLARPAIAALAILVAAGCDGVTEPRVPLGAAGVYVLANVSGRGPASGSFSLSSSGRAERRVRYAGQPGEEVHVGSFEVTPPEVVFTLHDPATPAAYVWSVRGEWRGTSFTFRHPDPADGPDIIETYRQ